jgi:hypothetical protein
MHHPDGMIVRDLATLTVWSEHRTARDIRDLMGVDPTRSHERGDPTRAALRGRVLPGQSPVEVNAQWSLDGDPEAADPEDESGFRTLRQLLSRIGHTADAIAELKQDCDVSITWSGYSDSWQGGFVLEQDLLQELGRLGIPIWGTTYLDDDSDEDGERDGDWTNSRAGMMRAVRTASLRARRRRLLDRLLPWRRRVPPMA